MSYFSDCLEKFEKLPKEFKDQFGSLEVFEKIESIEEEYGVDLKFLVVLVAIGEIILEDIPEYLQKKYGLAEEDAYEIRGLLIDTIFKNARNSNLLKDENNFPVLSSDELISFFREELVSVLKSGASTDEDIISINKSIFFWLAKDGLFQEILSKNLLNNQEKITGSRIVINDRENDPTISNWIKDFIQFHGSENFNDITLAEYLVNSKNIRALSIEDKDKIKKVLKIYRNLTFFPDSMKDDVDNWLFIPTDIKNDDNVVSSHKTTLDEEIEIEPASQSIPVVDDALEVSSFPDKPNNYVPKSTKPSLADELEIMLKDYPLGSLEHKTIEQELKRLRSGK